MSFDNVSESSNSQDIHNTSNGHKRERDKDNGRESMDASPGSSGRNSRASKHVDKGSPKYSSKSSKKKRKERSRSRSRERSRSHRDRDRSDRDSRCGRDYDRQRNDRKWKKGSRRGRSRSRSRSPAPKYSRVHKIDRRKRRHLPESDSEASDDELRRRTTLSGLISKDKTKSNRKRRGSSSSSSSTEDSTDMKTKPSTSGITPTPQSDPTAVQTLLAYHNAVAFSLMPQPPPNPSSISFMAPPPVPPPPTQFHILPSMVPLPPPVPAPPAPISFTMPGPPPVQPPPVPGPSTQQPSQIPLPQPGPPPMPPPPTSRVARLPLPTVAIRRERPVIFHRNRTVRKQRLEWGSECVDKYHLMDQVGEGTYGQVYKGNEKTTGRQVALKKVRLENEREGFPITAVREIKILRQLDHVNVVKLLDIVTDKATSKDVMTEKLNFYLVFEYVDHDLTGLLLAAANGIIKEFTPDQVQGMFKQLLQGLEYCHRMKFLHRDIKCSNILVNNKGELKIADYGLARIYHEGMERPYTNRVITLWYRPPELLLGEEHYGPPIDIWSVGCILPEFYQKTPLFSGQNEREQLEKIYDLCGSPSLDNWPDVRQLPHWETLKPRRIWDRKLQDTFKGILPNAAIDLLDKLLALDPKRRLSASDALKHHWLSRIDPTRVPPPQLPHNLDCHELWSKKLKRERRSGAQPRYSSQIVSNSTSQSSSSGGGRPRTPEMAYPSAHAPSLSNRTGEVANAVKQLVANPSSENFARVIQQIDQLSEHSAVSFLEQVKKTYADSISYIAQSGTASEQLKSLFTTLYGPNGIRSQPNARHFGGEPAPRHSVYAAGHSNAAGNTGGLGESRNYYR